ncbi:MAG: Type 1 glutamine amidotransferase-like domain-containing protein [Chloroflexota bacterium]
MQRTIALCGGNEFDQASMAFSRAILQLIEHSQAKHIVLLPVAATDNPRKTIRNGTGHFYAVGARPEAIMVVDKATAQDPLVSAPIETADVIYLADGNPLDAVEGLADTEALLKIIHYWSEGAILAASGAAAMALCDLYWDSGVWEKGLGVIKGIVVLPHHANIAGRFSGERLREGLPANYTILGLDDSTGVVIRGQEAVVVGPDIVTVYRADGEQEYEDGARFTLDQPLS